MAHATNPILHATQKATALIAVVGALLAGAVSHAAPATEPSASPSGGTRLRVSGGVELTREALAEAIRNYRGPEPADLEQTDGEDHEDNEAAPRTPAAGLGTAAANAAGALGLESPAPLVSFKAMNAQGGVAADTQIAVSTTNIVVTNRAVAAFFDKAGTPLGTVNATSLYAPLGLNSSSFWPAPINQYFDLRAIFDPYRKRFWVVGLGDTTGWKNFPPPLMRHVTAVAVSKSENPLDGWYLYWWDAVSHFGLDDDVYDPGDFSDYPTLGIDAALFHEVHAVNNFDFLLNKTFKYYRVSIHGADQMAAGLPPASVPSWEYWDLQNPDGTKPTKLIQAVVHHTAGPRSFYVSRQGEDRLVVWSLAKAFQPGQKMTAALVIMPSVWLDPIDAAQPQGGNPADRLIKMTNLGTNPLKAVYRDGYLYLVTNDAIYPFSAVRYVRLLLNTYPAIFTDSVHKFISRTFGVFDAADGPLAHAAWAAVEVNKSGNAAVVFARSSDDVYPEVRYSTWFANEADIRLSRQLKAGETSYHDGFNNFVDGEFKPMPWGDTAGASVDPKDDIGIWIAQHYSRFSPNPMNYGIWVGKVFGKTYFDLLFDDLRVKSSDRGSRQITVGGQLRNGGDGAAPAAQITVSLDVGRRGSIPLGTVPQEVAGPGATTSFEVTFPLPRNLDPGAYLVRATVATKAPRDEYSDGNNVAVASFVLR